MGCIETVKHFGQPKRRIMINSNMGCIETVGGKTDVTTFSRLIVIWDVLKPISINRYFNHFTINSNMGCIETSAGKDCNIFRKD